MSWPHIRLALAVLVLVASRAAAQDGSDAPPAPPPANPPPAGEPAPSPAVRSKRLALTLSGELGAAAANRQRYFTAGSGSGSSTRGGDSFVEPRFALDLRLDDVATDGVDGVVRIVNRRHREIEFFDLAEPDVDRPRAGSSALELRLEEAYLELGKLIGPAWSLRAGLQNLRYELRATGDAMFIHLARAESPFDGSPLSTGAGVRATYRTLVLEQPLDIDGFFLKTLESESLDADESLWGVNADLLVRGPADGVDNVINAIAAVISRRDDHIGTLGGGVDWHFSRNWEGFGEAYGQAGERTIDGRQRDHRAWSGQAGVRRTWFNLTSEPYIEGSAMYVSGGGSRGRSRDFVSYENVESFKIVEDDDYGYDVDSNYWSVRMRTGLDLSPALGEKVLFEVLYGYFRTAGTVDGLDRELGHEVDMRFVWKATESVEITFGAATLFGGDHFADRARRVGREGEDSALLLYIEAVLRF